MYISFIDWRLVFFLARTLHEARYEIYEWNISETCFCHHIVRLTIGLGLGTLEVYHLPEFYWQNLNFCVLSILNVLKVNFLENESWISVLLFTVSHCFCFIAHNNSNNVHRSSRHHKINNKFISYLNCAVVIHFLMYFYFDFFLL